MWYIIPLKKWAYSQRQAQKIDINLWESCQKGEIPAQAEAGRKMLRAKTRAFKKLPGIKNNEEIKARRR